MKKIIQTFLIAGAEFEEWLETETQTIGTDCLSTLLLPLFKTDLSAREPLAIVSPSDEKHLRMYIHNDFELSNQSF